ncbi:hypothetical protein GPLA_3327 [Paraglaciecola polaris LMG 21857]|uniref:Uncharacterized protein n=1 Tax=Paraglaciecola polaris LMG 21857 TaxID=1129793 RepID=K6ZDQ0_9ALTE|nr:hypothetical protein GPLA_3327 [Paraglaciecola polaris LMG 21857]
MRERRWRRNKLLITSLHSGAQICGLSAVSATIDGERDGIL